MIKFVIYDENRVSEDEFRALLNPHVKSLYDVKNGMSLVKADMTSKELYERLSTNYRGLYMLVLSVSEAQDEYWGVMRPSLWNWIKDNS